MTYEQCCIEIAIKHRVGNNLVTGHKASYFTEAAELYARKQREAAFYIANNTLEEQNIIAQNKLKCIQDNIEAMIKHSKKCRPDETGHGIILTLCKAILDIISLKNTK